VLLDPGTFPGRGRGLAGEELSRCRIRQRAGPATNSRPGVDTLIGGSRFSGVVRIDQAGETLLERAAGWAHRAHRVPTTLDTRLAVASGST